METEFDIIMAVYYDTINNINHLKSCSSRLNEIKNRIKTIDNNYFEVTCNSELFSNYIEIFNDNDEYNILLKDLEELKLYLEDKIQNMCNHEWVEDLIDIDPDRSLNICYCCKCEITKK
jgi:hypothetical protein